MSRLRRSVIAGSWYPGDPSVLRRDIAVYLSRVPDLNIQGDVKGIVAPHAGYIYSGQVAAYAYKAVQGRTYDTVILIGPSHRVAFSGASIYTHGAYETPLGEIPVDESLAGLIKEQSKIVSDLPAAHVQEHSLEIQLPFLQVVLGDFYLVPIVMGDQNRKVCEELADDIYRASKDRNVLIVGSSDLSHFHEYKKAKQLDGIVLEYIQKYDSEGLLEALASDKAEACGGGPTAVTMMVSKQRGALHSKILNYANSGDVTGDKGSVVGYASSVFYS
jgi:MEMO1 family protein